MGRERLERYSLLGPENQAAVQAGLAGGTWFRSAVPRKRMKELMRRSDYPAVRDTAIWIGLIALSAGLGITLWAAYKEIIPAILRQLTDQEYYVRRELLPGAAPFNEPTAASDGRARPLTGVTAA